MVNEYRLTAPRIDFLLDKFEAKYSHMPESVKTAGPKPQNL